MDTLKAKVVNGRLTLDEPTSLPEGTVLELVVSDDGDDLDVGERKLLHTELEAAWNGAKRGEGLLVTQDLVDQLRKKR